MTERIKRMLDEFKELNERVDKLEAFLNSRESYQIDKTELSLMAAQWHVMQTYSTLLGLRLKQYPEAAGHLHLVGED